MWMRHVGGHERFRTGDGQLNTQANRYVLQLGGDLAQWSSTQDRWHLGVMAGYANQHSNTQSNHVGYKSDGRISGYSAGLYATWYQNDANNNNLSLWGNVGVQLGDKGYSDTQGMLGVKYSW